MSVVTSSAPFPLGKTFYDGRTIDTSNYGGVNLEGQVSTFTNISLPKVACTIRKVLIDSPIVARLVRNVSGITLLPSRIAIYASGFVEKRVDGYTHLTAEEGAGIVDPFLPSNGVPNGDLFWLIESGVVPVRSPLTNFSADCAVGDILYAITAASSQAGAAGRFTRWGGTFSAAENTDGTAAKILLNHIGRAMSACTTAGTDQLINVRVKFNR